MRRRPNAFGAQALSRNKRSGEASRSQQEHEGVIWNPGTQAVWSEATLALIFERRQSLKHFRRPRLSLNRIIPSDFTVAENQHAFSELCNVGFMRNQNN